MSRPAKTSLAGWAVIFSFGFVLAGCGRKEPDAATPASASAVAGTSNFPVPFQGVIKAREQRDLLLRTDITYTIGPGKIRRESVRTDPLGKLVEPGKGSAGIICNVPAGTVILYRTGEAGKRFVRLTLAEYRKLIRPEYPTATTTSDGQLSAFTLPPDLSGYAGTFFRDIPWSIQGAQIVNRPGIRTANGLTCDLLTMQMGTMVLEVWHAPAIKADRALLELVELQLPAEVTGFPCLMRRLRLVPTQPDASKGQRLLQQTGEWITRLAEAAMKEEVNWQATAGAPPDSAFTLDNTFTEVASLDAFLRLFQPAPGGHHDWD